MLTRVALLLLLGNTYATCYCPTGAACDNNGTVVNLDDYWADPDDPHEFKKCVPHRCRADFQCERGYSGRMCARVSDGYYEVSRFGPYVCPSTKAGRALVATSGLLLVVLAFVLLNQLVLPKHPSLQIGFFHAAQTVALLRKITYDRDFGQGSRAGGAVRRGA